MKLVEYLRQFQRFQRNARLYLISNALSGITAGIFLVLYNLYIVSLGYSPDFIGIVLFVGTIGAALAIFPAGIGVDRLGGKFVLIWSSVLIALAGIGQILFRHPVSLLISAFIAGVGGAFVLVVNAPFLTATSTPEERSHLFSLNIVLGLITTVIGKVLGGALPVWFRSTGWLMGALPLHLEVLLSRQPEPRSYQLALLFAGLIAGPSFIPLFMLSNDRPARQRVSAALTVPEGQPQRSAWNVGWLRGYIATFWHALRRLRMREVVKSPIFLLTLVQVLIGLGAGLFIPYANLFFVKHLGASSALFGLIDGGATALTAVMTLLAPWLASRIGKVRSVALTELCSVPLLLMIGFVPVLPLVAVLYLLRQGLMDMSNGVLQVFSMEAVPRTHRGLANSSYQAAFQVAWASTASLGGLVITVWGYGPLVLGTASCYLLAIGTLWWNFGRKEWGDQKPIETEEEKVQPAEEVLHP